jgi:hypothetical protein
MSTGNKISEYNLELNIPLYICIVAAILLVIYYGLLHLSESLDGLQEYKDNHNSDNLRKKQR